MHVKLLLVIILQMNFQSHKKIVSWTGPITFYPAVLVKEKVNSETFNTCKTTTSSTFLDTVSNVQQVLKAKIVQSQSLNGFKAPVIHDIHDRPDKISKT